MIQSQDRSYYIGCSDTSMVVGNWKTKSFENWWLEKIGIYKNNVLFGTEPKDVSCGGNVTFDLPVGNYTIKEINPDSKYNVTNIQSDLYLEWCIWFRWNYHIRCNI